MFRRGFGAAALAVGLIFAPVAQADTRDDTFVKVLAQDGVGPSGSVADLVATGHQICDDIKQGADPVDVGVAVLQANAGRLSTQQAAWVVVAAIKVLCPDQESKLPTSSSPRTDGHIQKT